MNLGLCIQSFLLLEGMKVLAETEGWNRTVAEPCGDEDVLVLYSQSPLWSVLAEEVRKFCSAPIVLLTEGLNFVEADLDRFGVKGVIPSSATMTEIVTAINAVAFGNQFTHSSVKVEAGKGGLTDREREILVLLARGQNVKEIAVLFRLSVKTVEAHKFNLMKKLRVHNKAQLTLYAVSQGYIQA